MIITAQQALKLMTESDGLFFSVTFYKRTNGELRVMNCRTNVSKYVKGVGRSYNFEDKGLFPVYDKDLKQYRCIALEGLVSIRINNAVYEVSHT